jgi:two-component system response regulator (stage 0 sporulation protein F)
MSVKKILIVDDEEAIRLLLEETLEDEGYETLITDNAHRALEIIEKCLDEKCPIDLVILDIMMPGMKGVEAIPRILGLDEHIRVLMNTAYPQYREDFMTWAANAYVTKNADLGELLNKVKELVD